MAKDMTQGSLARTLAEFSIPLILSGVLQQLYSWADAFIVGNIEGEAALAAIGATTAATNLFVMAITGFTSGISILSARFYGSGDREMQKKILFSFTLILGMAALILSLVGVTAADLVLRLLHTPEDIFEMARGYLRIVLCGVPFITIYNVYAAVLRGIGDSKAPFLSVLVSSGVNVILDIIFVGGLRLGTGGAAAATVLSQTAMTVFVIGYSIRKYEILRFSISRQMLDTDVVKSGCALALPITVQSMINSGGNLILQNFMNGFGTPTVAAITSAYRVDCVILLPVINLGTGIATVTSQNTGAGEHKRARKGLLVGIGMMAAVSLCLTAIVLVFGGSLIEMFGVTKESALIGRSFFRGIAGFYIVFGTATAMRGYMEGKGDVLFSSMIGIVSLGLRIVLSYTLVPFFGNMVIAYAEAIAWSFMLILYIARFLTKHRTTAESLQKEE